MTTDKVILKAGECCVLILVITEMVMTTKDRVKDDRHFEVLILVITEMVMTRRAWPRRFGQES